MIRLKTLQKEISVRYQEAYEALQQANASLGVIADMANCIPIENGIQISHRSVMGIEVPIVHINPIPMMLSYGFIESNSRLDRAYQCFNELKTLTVTLAEVENSVYRLANAIRSTQRRANALENVVIPRYSRTTRFIADSLEEKDREEFSRMKMIKHAKARSAEEEAQEEVVK